MGTNKNRYIELHGEEAWEEERKRRNNVFNKWKSSHPDYWKKYPETRKENWVKWKSNNKEKLKEKERLRYKNNPNKLKEWAKNNPKKARARDICSGYKGSDFEKGFDISNNVTSEWIIENIFTSKCIYCGDNDWQHLGCDRIDNDKPHTPDNVVCSCGICNVERNDRYSVEEFIEYRKQHPRACDTKKEPSINDKGFLIKKKI